jgi:1-acyl-sn-glycerol-3-phosphate acyltransferase
MSALIRLLRRLVCLTTGFVSWSYLIFVLNPVQMLSMGVYPISKAKFRAINRVCAFQIWRIWIWIAEDFGKTKLRFTGDRLPIKENAVLICNHQSITDIVMLLCVAHRCQRLGDLKFFVKNIMRYIPGPGWGMVFLDCIFLKRNWTEDKAAIDKLFSKYKDDQIPLFLVSFLDGTRFRPRKLPAAQAYARQRGLPVPEHTLVPRTKGFVATIHGLHSHLDAVYDITLAYERRPAPTAFDCFHANVGTVDIHIRRTPVSELPIGDEAALERWVHDRYQEKNDRLACHLREGVFRD